MLYDTLILSWPRGHNAWQNLVAVLGTTIGPYLFFWQAFQEVEEEKAMGRRMLVSREGATKREIFDRRIDVTAGTFFSNLVMYFIILSAALTLHAHNDTNVESSRQVAETLKPLAVSFAATLTRSDLSALASWQSLVSPVQAHSFCRNIRVEGRIGFARYNGAIFLAVIAASTLLGIDGFCKN